MSEVAPGLCDVLADRDRVLQVLANLIDNAVKYTPAGGTITVGARLVAPAVEVYVRDTGCGMEADHLHHIFDRFWQVRRDRRGAGLGLAIARGIVEAHG